MNLPRVRILHETNPRKYFPALFALEDAGAIMLAGEHRYSVLKEWVRAGIKDRTPWLERTRHALGDLRFRALKHFVRDEVIVMGFAPWDWRILLYRALAEHNRVLYHTSWHDWHIDRTPRQLRPYVVKRWLRDKWLEFVRLDNVEVIAVTPMAADAVRAATGRTARVIPHAVPASFFKVGHDRTPRAAGPLRLLFVGEVSEKKGVGALLKLMKKLPAGTATLTVVGDGKMTEAVRSAGWPVTFRGPIKDRKCLADEMGRHDVLVLLSQRSATWEELFGIVVVEALAAGLAVIASDHVGPRGLLQPVGGPGLFREDDLEGVTALVQQLANDPDALPRLRTQQRTVAAPFAVDTVMRAWQEAIQR